MPSNQDALKAVEEYVGEQRWSGIRKIECIPDPQVEGVWAVRVEGYEFLVHVNGDVEEVQFTEWPPTTSWAGGSRQVPRSFRAEK